MQTVSSGGCKEAGDTGTRMNICSVERTEFAGMCMGTRRNTCEHLYYFNGGYNAAFDRNLLHCDVTSLDSMSSKCV